MSKFDDLPLSEASLLTSSFVDKDWRPKRAQKVDLEHLEWINLYFNWIAATTTQRATSKYWMTAAQRIVMCRFLVKVCWHFWSRFNLTGFWPKSVCFEFSTMTKQFDKFFWPKSVCFEFSTMTKQFDKFFNQKVFVLILIQWIMIFKYT